MHARYVVLLSGKVQRGGFRSFIKKHALLLGVTGYAENLTSGEVLLVLEGEEGSILKLLEMVEKEAPAFIEIEKIQKRRESYRGSFSDFERKGADVLEDLESSDTKSIMLKLVSYAKSSDEKLERGIEILGTMKNQQDTMLEKQDEMLGKMDTMLEKQDEHIEVTREIARKQEEHIEVTREIARKQEEHIEVTREIARKQEEHIEVTREISRKQEEHMEISKRGFESVAEELKGYRELHEEIRELREEFARLKEALREAGISVG